MKTITITTIFFILLSFNLFSANYGDTFNGRFINEEYGFYVDIQYYEEIDGYYVEAYEFDNNDSYYMYDSYLFIEEKDFVYRDEDAYYFLNDKDGKTITMLIDGELVHLTKE